MVIRFMVSGVFLVWIDWGSSLDGLIEWHDSFVGQIRKAVGK